MEGVLAEEVHGGQLQLLVAGGAARGLEHELGPLQRLDLLLHARALLAVLRRELLLALDHFVLRFQNVC